MYWEETKNKKQRVQRNFNRHLCVESADFLTKITPRTPCAPPRAEGLMCAHSSRGSDAGAPPPLAALEMLFSKSLIGSSLSVQQAIPAD